MDLTIIVSPTKKKQNRTNRIKGITIFYFLLSKSIKYPESMIVITDHIDFGHALIVLAIVSLGVAFFDR
jgi:hypothetical protein